MAAASSFWQKVRSRIKTKIVVIDMTFFNLLRAKGAPLILMLLSLSLASHTHATNCRTGNQISLNETSSTIIDNVHRSGKSAGKGGNLSLSEFRDLVKDRDRMLLSRSDNYVDRLGINSNRVGSFEALLEKIDDRCSTPNNGNFQTKHLFTVLDITQDGQINGQDRDRLLSLRERGSDNNNDRDDSDSNNNGSEHNDDELDNNSNFKVRIANRSSRSDRGKTYGVCCISGKPRISGDEQCRWTREGRVLVQQSGPGGRQKLRCPENGNKSPQDCTCTTGGGENMHGHNNPHNIDDIRNVSNPIYPDYGWPFCTYVDTDHKLKTKRSERRDKDLTPQEARDENKNKCDSFTLD